MKPKKLKIIGTALYGPRWQNTMADVLEHNPRTIRRWVAGQVKISKKTQERLFLLLWKRRVQLNEIIDSLAADLEKK